MTEPPFAQFPGVCVHESNLLEARMIVTTYNQHVRLLSSEPFGWFAPPKSTRAWEPTLFMESLHSATWDDQFVGPSVGRVVTETTSIPRSKPSVMEAAIASENSSIRARPMESKSLSACRTSRDPSHSQCTFWCHGLWVNSLAMSRAATAPTSAGTPLQARTIRYM